MSLESDNNTSFAHRLASFSLERRVAVLMIVLTTLVVGWVAMLGIPVELVPRGFQSQFLFVNVPWQGAPTREVMDKVTLPLEEELSTVRGLDGMNSFSSVGRSGVFLRFKQGADMAIAYREVRDRVQRARARFPEDVDRVFIRKEDASGIPVAVIGMAMDPSLTDSYNLVMREVVEPLTRIDGVANVTTDGLEEKEILIEVDRKLAESNAINLYQLAQKMGGDNFTMASGQVREEGKKFLLRSMATFRSLEELQNLPLTPTVRLRDIAKIRYEEEEKRYMVRVNSRPAVAVIILKEGEANTVDVSRRIKQELDRIKANPRLGSIEMEDLFNQGKVVEEAVDGLLQSGWVGSILSAMILFAFLRRVRLTLIITLSVPLSLLAALIFMYFAGETLNVITILALVISVGMLVDNAICVAENITEMHSRGVSRKEACMKGPSEIALAITLATLTTVIVFVPAALVEGQGQFFMVRLALPITVSLLASLFVALVLVPLCVYLTLSPRDALLRNKSLAELHHKSDVLLTRVYDTTIGRLNRVYVDMLGFMMTRRFDLVLGLLVLFAATGWLASKKLKIVPNQEENQTSFEISAEGSGEVTFDDMKEYFTSVEKVMEAEKVKYGLKGYFIFSRSRFGRVEGWFDKNYEGELTAKEVGKQLLDKLPQKPGIKLFYGRESQMRESTNKDNYVFNLEGDDPDILDNVAEQLEPRILQIPGVIGLRRGNEQVPKELAFVINRDRANASGVSPQTVAGIVGYALRGNSLPKYNDNGKEIPVRVRFQESDRETVADLQGFTIPTESGNVPLSALTETRMLKTPQGIFRRDKRVTRTITVELTKATADQARGQLEGLKQTTDLPEGVYFGRSSFDRTQAEEIKSLMFAGTLSVFFIYLLMGFLFESFILPLSIILTIPLASVGVVWMHFITKCDIDFLGIVGMILLVGVVVNNGIVLVDYVHQLRNEGMDRGAALLLAARRRFRPIMMTALTTIIGMIPMALSKPSEIGLSYESFGMTLIGGMTTATVLTLLVVPVFYTFFDDAREFFASVISSVVSPNLQLFRRHNASLLHNKSAPLAQTKG